MARTPRPWYDATRKAWYVNVGGERHRLAAGPESTTKSQAQKVFHELMAARGRQPAVAQLEPAVGELVVAYLKDLRGRWERDEVAASTLPDALRRMADFPDRCGDMRASEIRPKDVNAWLLTKKDWGPTSRHDAVVAVRRVFRWAVEQGLLEADPLAGMKSPTRAARREQVISPAEVETLFGAILRHEFRLYLEFVYASGCRPGEAMRLEAQHLRLEQGMAVLPGKTTRKTGRQRVIYLTPTWSKRLQALAIIRPEGPLFRNSLGRPWTRYSVKDQFRRIRERTGLGRGTVAYALRHRFATDALISGLRLAEVAELMGHASPAVTAAVYSHLRDHPEHMHGALAKVRREDAPSSGG